MTPDQKLAEVLTALEGVGRLQIGILPSDGKLSRVH